MTVAPSPDLIRMPEAAERLGLHTDTLYKLARTGQFPPAVRIGSRWLVSVPRLERFLHGETENADASVIIRTPNRLRYATIDKTGLEDVRLSFKARGLLAFLLSKPDNWEVYTAYLVKSGPDGRASVLSGLRELEEAGYIRRMRGRDAGGQWDGTDVHVFETPQVENRTAVTAGRFSVGGEPVGGKSTQSEELIPLMDDLSPQTPSSSASGGKGRRGMRGTGTSPREIKAVTDQLLAAEAAEAELDRLVTAIPETYAHLSPDVVLEKIAEAFPDDGARRRDSIEHYRLLTAKVPDDVHEELRPA